MSYFLSLISNLSVPELLLLLYLSAINIATFFIYGADKFFSVSNRWRVRERTLLLLALFGGSVGALGATQAFRHKRRKASFYLPLLLIFLLQIIGIWLYTTYLISPPLDAPAEVF